MDPFLEEQCLKLVEKIEKKPIGKMLLNDWKDYSGQLTLEIIKQKLKDHKYLTPFDFSLDMRLLLEPKVEEEAPNPIQVAILDDLTNWLNYKLLNMPRSKEEMDYMHMQKCVRKLQYILRALMYNPPKSAHQIVGSAQHKQIPPNREGLHSSQKRIDAIQQRIEKIKKPEDLQGVLRILQKYVPQLTLSNEVVIEGRLITKQCVAELRSYLNSISV